MCMDIRKVNKGDFLTLISRPRDKRKRIYLETIEIHDVNEGSVVGSQITSEFLIDLGKFNQQYLEGGVKYESLYGFRKSRLCEIFRYTVLSTNIKNSMIADYILP